MRTLASKVGIPKSRIHDALKKGLLEHTQNTIRPILTDKNKADRVVYCCSFVQDGQFVDMLERVDIDEKWFYMTEVATSYILVPGETPPHQACKHKSHIEKVMCLTAVARPRQSPMNGEWWDRKTGNWFFVEQVPAKRTSKNRPVGTLETKSFKVGKKESIEMYLDNLLPGIILKWPEWWPKSASPSNCGKVGSKDRCPSGGDERRRVGYQLHPSACKLPRL